MHIILFVHQNRLRHCQQVCPQQIQSRPLRLPSGKIHACRCSFTTQNMFSTSRIFSPVQMFNIIISHTPMEGNKKRKKKKSAGLQAQTCQWKKLLKLIGTNVQVNHRSKVIKKQAVTDTYLYFGLAGVSVTCWGRSFTVSLV